LIGLEQHQAFLREVVRAVLARGAAAETGEVVGVLSDMATAAPAQALGTELEQQWSELARIGVECSLAAQAAIEAARQVGPAEAEAHLDRLFGASGALVRVLVGASLVELSNKFAEHERDALARYEHDVLDAAQIGCFSFRAADGTVYGADEKFAELFGRRLERVNGMPLAKLLGGNAIVDSLLAQVSEGKTARMSIRPRDA
jgi:hypothetical protein